MADQELTAPVPYKCAHVPNNQTACVKYYWDAQTGRWDRPQFGEPCTCEDCKYWMSEIEIQDLIKRGQLKEF
jgi:hypothetical protein